MKTINKESRAAISKHLKCSVGHFSCLLVGRAGTASAFPESTRISNACICFGKKTHIYYMVKRGMESNVQSTPKNQKTGSSCPIARVQNESLTEGTHFNITFLFIHQFRPISFTKCSTVQQTLLYTTTLHTVTYTSCVQQKNSISKFPLPTKKPLFFNHSKFIFKLHP